jgi:hypothetical protein
MSLDCRASLLRRGFNRGWFLNVFAAPVLLLRPRTGRSALLERSLLPWISRLGRFLPSPLSRRGPSLSCLLIKVLADYCFTRLVTVMPAAQRLLLLHLPRIPVSRILTLVNRQWRGRRR